MPGKECLPLKTMEAVGDWKEGEDELCVSSVPLAERSPRTCSVPLTLLCHDMRGGYQQDRFVQGCGDPDSYRFYHWQYIDMFVYFSHYFVTIPPPTWTNAAHRNGVKMLGTLITEWDDGFKRTEQILESEESYKNFADKLIRITKYYKFDGWLVNIENKVEESKVKLLCDFVSYLTENLHNEVSGSKVIWYDSVIKNGELKWQNDLNESNCIFFDGCDGIFLNYNWKDDNLQNAKSMASCKNRAMDVFVGIDVFGRGCLGGGGYNTVEALTAIRRHNMSAAIFAQGWVHETQGCENFLQNENSSLGHKSRVLTAGVANVNTCMHASVHPFVSPSTHKKDISDETAVQILMKLAQKHIWVVSDQAWHNLSLQELQPTYTGSQFMQDQFMNSHPTISLCTEDAYIGGGCLKFEAHPPVDYMPLMFKLFDTHIEIKEPTMISYTYKFPSKTNCDIFIECAVSSSGGKEKYLILRGDNPQEQDNENNIVLTPMSHLEIQKELHQSLPVSLENWVTRIFKVDPKDMTGMVLESVSVGMYTVPQQLIHRETVLLGQLQIVPISSIPSSSGVLKKYPQISDFQIQESNKNQSETGSLLSWKCIHQPDVKYFSIYTGSEDNLKLLGQSACPKLELPPLACSDDDKFEDESGKPVGKAAKHSKDSGENDKSIPSEVFVQCVLNTGFISPLLRQSVHGL